MTLLTIDKMTEQFKKEFGFTPTHAVIAGWLKKHFEAELAHLNLDCKESKFGEHDLWEYQGAKVTWSSSDESTITVSGKDKQGVKRSVCCTLQLLREMYAQNVANGRNMVDKNHGAKWVLAIDGYGRRVALITYRVGGTSQVVTEASPLPRYLA